MKKRRGAKSARGVGAREVTQELARGGMERLGGQAFRYTSPVNGVLRRMAEKVLHEKVVKKQSKYQTFTQADIEALRPLYLEAFRKRTTAAFLRTLAEQKGRSPSWWRNAFSGFLRLA